MEGNRHSHTMLRKTTTATTTALRIGPNYMMSHSTTSASELVASEAVGTPTPNAPMNQAGGPSLHFHSPGKYSVDMKYDSREQENTNTRIKNSGPNSQDVGRDTSVKELQNRIEKLENENTTLHASNAQLKRDKMVAVEQLTIALRLLEGQTIIQFPADLRSLQARANDLFGIIQTAAPEEVISLASSANTDDRGGN